jgi:RNA polymerase sigma-70 factor (ECF subfamily)
LSTPAAELFERHHVAVYRFLRRMTGCAATAEDLTQEVFLKVVRAFETYEDREREKAWVFRIARNVLIDSHRKSTREIESAPLETAPAAGYQPPHSAAVILQDALERLADVEREAFLLREVGGLSYDEIGRLTNVTPDAVRMRIYRARSALRASLAGIRAGVET